MDENQNKQQMIGGDDVSTQGVLSPSLRENMLNIMRNRREIDKANTEKNKSKLVGYTNDFYAHDSADDNVNTKYKQVSNYNGIAYMIYDYSIAEGAKNVPANPRGIMDAYSEAHPENMETITNAIMDTDLDLEKFGREQGWIPSEDDEKIGGVIGWLGDVIDTYGSFANIGANSARNFITKEEERINRAMGNEEAANRARDYGVLENLAYVVYGKNTNELTDREIAKLQEMTQDPKVMDDYASSEIKGVVTGLGALLDGYISLRYPSAKLKLSAMANTPVLNIPVEGLGELIGLAGYVIDAGPGLYQIKENLGSEEYKDIMDMSVASALALKAAKNKKVQRWTQDKLMELANDYQFIGDTLRIYNMYKDWIDNTKAGLREKAGERSYNAGKYLGDIRYGRGKEQTPKATEKEVVELDEDVAPKGSLTKDMISDEVNNLKRNFRDPAVEKTTNRADWNRRGEAIEDWNKSGLDKALYDQNELSTKITQGKTPIQREAVTDTLNTLDRDVKSGIRNYEEGANAIQDNISNPIIEYENKLLNSVDKVISKSEIETRSSGETSQKGAYGEYKSEWGSDPVEDALNMRRKMRRYDGKAPTQEDSYYETFLERYQGEGVKLIDLYNLARELTKQFKLYKENGSGVMNDTITADNVNKVRVALKNIAKDIIKEEYGGSNPQLVNALSILDEVYSKAATTTELFSEMAEKATGERGKKPAQNQAQRDASSIYKAITDVKKVASDMFLGEKSLTPETVNSQLNYYLKLHDELFDSLGRKSKYDLEGIKSDIDSLIKNDIENNPMLKSPDVPLENKVQYIEGYQEALVNLFKALGYKEQAVEAANAMVEPLFEIVDPGKRTDFLGRKTGYKKKGK